MAKATYRQMTNFFDRLSVVLQAGVDIRTALGNYRDSVQGSQKIVMTKILQDIDEGSTFASAMRNRDPYFPAMVVSMIDAGEQGGRLPAAARRVSDYFKALIDVRTQFLSAIAWPVFQLVLCILIIGVLILVLGYIGSSGGNKVDPFGFGFSTGTYFAIYLSLVLFSCISLAGGYFLVRSGALGSLPIDISRKIPVLGRTIEMLTLSRFCWTMATAVEAGVQATETVRLAIESTQQYYYTRFLQKVDEKIRSGGTFASALNSLGILPEDLLQAVEVGETTGKIPESMQQIATLYDHDSRRNLKVLGTVASTAVVLMIFVSIGVVIIRMYQTMYLKPIQDLL